MLRCQCPSVCDGSALWSRCMLGRGEGSSRAMLATARPSCFSSVEDLEAGVVLLPVSQYGLTDATVLKLQVGYAYSY